MTIKVNVKCKLEGAHYSLGLSGSELSLVHDQARHVRKFRLLGVRNAPALLSIALSAPEM